MDLARLFLVLCVPVYGGIGASFLVAPVTMASLVGVSLGGATADNDVRAVYGGVSLALALFFAISVPRRAWHVPAVVLVALTLGAMASARILSIVLVGPPEPIGFVLHASELVGFAAALFVLRRIGREPGP